MSSTNTKSSNKKRRKCKTCHKYDSSDDSESEHDRCPPNELFDSNETKLRSMKEMIENLYKLGILTGDGVRLKEILRSGMGKYLIPTYDENIHTHFADHAIYARVARRLTKMKSEAISDFQRYPCEDFAPLQFWEELYPVYDLALYRTSHFFEKYKRIPSSLFWTNFENQELIDRLNPSCLTNDKYENVDLLLQDLMDLDLRVHKPNDYKEDLENRKLKHIMRSVLDGE